MITGRLFAAPSLRHPKFGSFIYGCCCSPHGVNFQRSTGNVLTHTSTIPLGSATDTAGEPTRGSQILIEFLVVGVSSTAGHFYLVHMFTAATFLSFHIVTSCLAAELTAFSLSTGDFFHLHIARSKLPVLPDRF